VWSLGCNGVGPWQAFDIKTNMELKFRLEEVLGRDVDLVLKDALKPRMKPIIEKEVRYV
jgi:predicted nucleotidyltransferase